MKQIPAKMDEKYYADEYIKITRDFALCKRSGTLSKNAQVLEYHLLRSVNPNEGEFPSVTITERTLKELRIVDKHKSTSQLVRELSRELRHFDICTFNPETGDWHETTLCSGAQKKGGEYILRFDPGLKPFLLQLKSNFAQIGVHPLFSVCHSRQPYAYPLYLFLRKHLHTDQRSSYMPFVPISELREIIGANGKSYDMWIDFKRYVLEPALKEINKETDISVIIPKDGYGKTGKAITHLKFSIVRQAYQLHFNSELDEQRQESFVGIPNEVKDALTNINYVVTGSNFKLIKNICENHKIEVILEAINRLNNDVGKYFAVAKLINSSLLHHIQRIENRTKRQLEIKLSMPAAPDSFIQTKLDAEEQNMATNAESFYWENKQHFDKLAFKKFGDMATDSELITQLAIGLAQIELAQPVDQELPFGENPIINGKK